MRRIRSNMFSSCVVLIALMLAPSGQVLAQTRKAEGEFKNNPPILDQFRFLTFR